MLLSVFGGEGVCLESKVYKVCYSYFNINKFTDIQYMEKQLQAISHGSKYNAFHKYSTWIHLQKLDYIQNYCLNSFYTLLNNGYLFNDHRHKTLIYVSTPYSWQDDMNCVIRNIVYECERNEKIKNLINNFIKEFL
jgi:hypothetical protein